VEEGVGEIVLLSIEVTVAAVVLAAVLGVPLGAWLGLARFRGRSIVVLGVNVAMGLPPVLVGLVVYLLLSRQGPLAALGWLFTPPAMILAQTVLCLPMVVGIAASATAAVPRELGAQLASLGGGPWQIRRAIVREARVGIGVALAAAVGRSTSEVGAVLMVGGNVAGHTRVLTTAVVLETGQGHFATALSLGAWLLALTLVANLVTLRLQRVEGA
jgi:tungstate transport system permease protein